MICITFGYVIVLLIILMLLALLIGDPTFSKICSFAGSVVVLYWLVGLFVSSWCDSYAGINK